MTAMKTKEEFVTLLCVLHCSYFGKSFHELYASRAQEKNTNLRTKRRCRDVFFLLSDLQNTIGNLQWRQGPHVSPRATAQLRTLWWISLLSQSKGWCWHSFGGVNPVKSNTFTFEIEACPACPNVFFNCTKLRHTHKHYKRAPLDKRDFTLAS